MNQEITLDGAFPFGKYKGQNVADVIAKDPGYLCWLRGERLKDSVSKFGVEGTCAMEDRVHELLDTWLDNNPKEARLYKRPTRVRAPSAPVLSEISPNAAIEAPAQSIESWGSW